MCCYSSRADVNKILKRFNRTKSNTIIGWKRLVYKNKKLKSYLFPKTWKSGENKSTTRTKKIKTSTIDAGIHVYLKQKIALRSNSGVSILKNWNNEIILVLPVLCKLEDLIGADHETAVFSKVTIIKREYDKAIKAAKCLSPC